MEKASDLLVTAQRVRRHGQRLVQQLARADLVDLHRGQRALLCRLHIGLPGRLQPNAQV